MFQNIKNRILNIKKIYLIYTGQITSGICLILFLKLQDRQIIDGVSFQHAYIQSQITFLGQMINLSLYQYQLQYNQQELEEEKQQAIRKNKELEIPYQKLVIPSLLHTLAQITNFASIIHLQASVQVMLYGAMPIITSMLSEIFFKRSVSKNQQQGIGIIMIGSFLLGFVAYLNEEQDKETNTVLGIILCIISMFLFGMQMISEEYLLRNYHIQSTLIAGTEGLVAFGISIVLIPVIGMVNSDLINIGQFFRQLGKSNVILISCLMILISDMLHTLFGILAIKYSSAITRSVLFNLRIIGIWIFTLYLQWEVFNFAEFLGYIILCIGVFIYYEHLQLIKGEELEVDSLDNKLNIQLETISQHNPSPQKYMHDRPSYYLA